jgi:hypothetical protein
MKKGQILIIAAIIIILAIYSVIIPYNIIKVYKPNTNHEQIADDYSKEYPKIINYAIENSKNPMQEVDNFTKIFLEDARIRDPSFGLYYIFKDNLGNIHISNTLNKKVLSLQLTNLEGKDVNISLMSANHPTNGTICVDGMGCITSTAFVGDFDSAYYQYNLSEKPENLRIEILGSSNPASTEPDLNTFTSMVYLTSEEELQGTGIDNKQVQVKINQY